MLIAKKYCAKKNGVLLFLVLILLLLFSYLKFYQRITVKNIIHFKNLHNGDIVLRCGRSTESFTVYLVDDNSEFTHIGIISLENDIPYVIHSVPSKTNFIQKEKLSIFLNSKNASKFAIYRSNFNEVHLDKVVKTANSYYLNKYVFDPKYDLTTNTKLYCTELVLKAFNTVGSPLKVKPKELNYIIGKHSIIFPSEFTKLPFFTRII